MELECRDKGGNYKFTIRGEFAKAVVKYLEGVPQIQKSVQKMKGKDGKPPYDSIVYQPIVEQGVGFKNEFFETVIFYGDYIRVKD
jgi:hypothetical protein